MAGALIVATLLSVLIFETVKSFWIRNLICFAFLAPVLLPRVAAAFIWRFLYFSSLGLINYLVGLTGLGPVEFLADPFAGAHVGGHRRYLAMGSVFSTVIMLKLLETLPKDPIEARSSTTRRPGKSMPM